MFITQRNIDVNDDKLKNAVNLTTKIKMGTIEWE